MTEQNTPAPGRPTVVDANRLAGLVARHPIDLDDARATARALAYDLVRRTFAFDWAGA